ncbi:transposase [Mesorhizobium carmichaelinearum]|uniref:transposase n=1 Tax=Mesorhizobium carmichaelinearum TaxID=1208188 RepID=UPI0015C986AF|nr:transposase [Mesorhizobium carmichaelinearum]
MKQQIRPFIVEVKQKRGVQKQGRPIWGDVDLSAIAAEVARDAEVVFLPNPRPVDTVVGSIDAEDQPNQKAEPYMADPQEAQSRQVTMEASATPNPLDTKKKTLRPRKAKAAPNKPARTNGAKPVLKAAEVPAIAVRTGRKVHSQIERSQKLTQIEKSVAGGDTMRSAVGQAGISEQTYYLWKKAAAPAQDSGDLKDLLALEEENERLKGMLAEHLRKENAELKKRLGLV